MARGKGEGTIYKRPNGTWTAQATVGIKEDGRPDRVTVYGKTRGEVSLKLNRILNDVEDGSFIKTSNIRLGEWLLTRRDLCKAIVSSQYDCQL